MDSFVQDALDRAPSPRSYKQCICLTLADGPATIVFNRQSTPIPLHQQDRPMSAHSKRYSAETQERAVRRVAETRDYYQFEGEAIAVAASLFGIHPETLRKWVRARCSSNKCPEAESPAWGCKCDCDGAFHGSTRRRPGPRPAASEAGAVSPRPNKTVRKVLLAVTAAAVITVGPLTLTGTFDTSPAGSTDFVVQVKVDLDKALSALAAILGFRSVRTSKASPSQLSYQPDYAANATGKVKKFLTLHRCNQSATTTQTIVKPGATTLVAFSWVEMPTTTLAGRYKTTVDRPRTGNPPGVSLSYNGYCYASGQQGAMVWAIFVKPTGHVNVDRQILQVAARRKLALTYLRLHCIS